MATTPDVRRLPRFSRTERALHWVHASAFLVLLGSGLAWLAALGLVLLAGDRRRLLAAAREVDRFDADDRAWLRGRGTPQGRLNAGQKINAIVTAAFAVLFSVTGFFLWYGERDHAFRLKNALLVHDWLMYISFFLLLGHLYLSLINRSTRLLLAVCAISLVAAPSRAFPSRSSTRTCATRCPSSKR